MKLPNYVITPRAGRTLVCRPLGAPHMYFTHHPVITNEFGSWEVCDFPDAEEDDRLSEDHSDPLLHERACRFPQETGTAASDCPWCRLMFLRERVYLWNVIDRSDGAIRVLKLDEVGNANLVAAAGSIVSAPPNYGLQPAMPSGLQALGYMGEEATYDYEIIATPSFGWWGPTASPYNISVQPKAGSLSPLRDSDWTALRLINSDATTLEGQRRLRDLTTIVAFVPLSYESQRELFGDVLWPDPALAAKDEEAVEPVVGPHDHLRLPPIGEWEE